MLRALALVVSLASPALGASAPDAPAPAQGEAAAQGAAQETFEKVELRVTSARIGSVIVDRGSIDGVEVGDRVLFFPREGGTFEGAVVEVEERSARVDLHDPGFAPSPGTRGEVRVPSARRRVAPPTAEPGAVVPPTELPEHPPWERTEETWTSDQPLLAQVRPLEPNARPMHVSGRLYSIVDQTWSGEDSRTDLFARLGAGVVYENPFGNGAKVHLDGELNFRDTDVSDDQDDEEKTRLRLDRFSYAIGGTRFSDHRFEVGRFLQHEMPEFGVLDGFEWGRRLVSGSRFGVSAGFMPEPDEDQETGDDLQLAGFYRWVSDESERLAITGGYQKTWHDLAADRDLAVAKFDYLPVDAWTLRGTTWVDIYGSTDDAKGAGVELTEAYVTAGRVYEDRSSIHWTYSHIAFPEIEREEFTPVAETQLADDHSDRIGVRARYQIAEPTALFAEAGAWVDEDDDGGDGELGFQVEDLFADRGLMDVALFGTSGRFNTSLGARMAFGRTIGYSHWRIAYEYSQQDIAGFESNNDDLPQHVLRTSYDTHRPSGWSFSAHVDTVLWDDEAAVTVGFYLQRSF